MHFSKDIDVQDLYGIDILIPGDFDLKVLEDFGEKEDLGVQVDIWISGDLDDYNDHDD